METLTACMHAARQQFAKTRVAVQAVKPSVREIRCKAWWKCPRGPTMAPGQPCKAVGIFQHANPFRLALINCDHCSKIGDKMICDQKIVEELAIAILTGSSPPFSSLLSARTIGGVVLICVTLPSRVHDSCPVIRARFPFLSITEGFL